MSSGGGGGGAGERAWPELAKSMSDLDIQLSNGDIKCANCDEPATKATDKLKFYCAEHIAIQFKGFSTDDVGDDVWEFEELGYFSWADKDVLEKKGRQDIIKFIEEHEEFGEWHDKCPGCLSSVENCQKECAECVEWSGDEDEDEDEEEHHARCSIAGCPSDTNQGVIAEHQKTKLLYCVEHAVEGIRNNTITDWDFKEFGVDLEHPPEGYDCLAINPKCVQCEVRLSEDDMAEWLKNPAAPPSCEDCLGGSVHSTCCVECGESFKFDVPVPAADYHNNDHDQVCPSCVAKKEKAEDEMAHLEAQVEAHIEQVAESRGGRK